VDSGNGVTLSQQPPTTPRKLLQLSDDQYTIKGLQYALKKMEVYAQN
jgi:hypothetical protein